MEKNYELTDDQFDMIRNALERYYYTCRGDGDFVQYLEPLEELERSLLKQKQEQDNFSKEMYDLIDMCYHDITNQHPTDEVMLKVGVEAKESFYHEAMQWGWDDTEVRDKVYVYIKKQIEKGRI